MKYLYITLFTLTFTLSSCLDTDNSSYVNYNSNPGNIINVPNGNTDQFLVHSLNRNIVFYPLNLPDSMKVDSLQIEFSGSSSDDFHTIDYTDSDGQPKTARLPELNLSGIARSQLNMTVYYGTSFGECAGYCKAALKLERRKLSFQYYGQDTITHPIMSCSRSLSNDTSEMILNYINKQQLYDMDDVYGCPDCADGGSEWILVEHGYFSKKITFEYLNEPEELTPYITILRELATSSTCNPN